MSENTTDDNYIDSKKKTNESNKKIKKTDYTGFITDIIKNGIMVLILFSISAGIIFNVNNPKYIENGFKSWPGSDINSTPYAPDKSKQSVNSTNTNTTNSNVISKFFDLSIFSTPYDLNEVKILLSKQSKLDEHNTKYKDTLGPIPSSQEEEGLGIPQVYLWPWAIRMTALSYSWMRLFFEAGFLSMMPTYKSTNANIKNNILFAFGWWPLISLNLLLIPFTYLMTLGGAIHSFKSWAWVGTIGMTALAYMAFFPVVFYILGLIFVPMFVGTFNTMIQPLFYLAFMFEPLFKHFDEVKNIILDHINIVSIAGILITIKSAFDNSEGDYSFGIGVTIMGIVAMLISYFKKDD